MSRTKEALLDSTLLILLISPAFYWFLLQPLLRELKAREIAEAKLENSRAVLRTVFDGISDPLLLLDDNCMVRILNKAAREYYDLPEGDAIGKRCFEALDNEAAFCRECRAAARTSEPGSTSVWERKSIRRPGRIEQLIVYHPPSDRTSDRSIIFKINDITNAKLMEKRLLHRERIASLGLLISNVAHEINNPNNFISFNIPILRDYLGELLPLVDAYRQEKGDKEFFNMSFEEFGRDLHKLIDNIENGADRIDHIVSRLKNIIRMGREQDLLRVDPKAIIEKAIHTCAGEMEHKAIRFEVDVQADLPEMTTDPHAVEQVLINLLIHAAQASDKRDARVRLEVSTAGLPDNHLHIVVRDNGCGMDNETQKRIFDPMGTGRDGGGENELGLFACHTLIDGLGGSIQVESSPGQGSAFEVLLPLESGADPDDRAQGA